MVVCVVVVAISRVTNRHACVVSRESETKGGTRLNNSTKPPRATRTAPRRAVASNTKHRVPDSQNRPLIRMVHGRQQGPVFASQSYLEIEMWDVGSSSTQVELTLQGRSAVARSCNVPFQLHGICVLWYGIGAGYPEQKAYSCWQHIKDDC